MTITQLEYAIAVSKYGSFTNAAEKCIVTQPTLSMQVQNLENELKTQIFIRGTKPIQLTDVGKKIIDQANKILNEVKRIEDLVSYEKNFIGGEFKLGIIPTVIPTLLPLFLNKFTKKYPNVNLVIEESKTDNIVKQIIEGNLDGGITATPLNNEYIKEKPLYYEPFVAYIPSSHNLSKINILSIEDLKYSSILILEDGHSFREQTLKICKTEKKSNFNFEIKSGSFETLTHLVDEGFGITLLPLLYTKNLTKEKKKNLKLFKEPEPVREISLIYPKNQLKIQIINALSNSIAYIFRNLIKLNDIKIISPDKK